MMHQIIRFTFLLPSLLCSLPLQAAGVQFTATPAPVTSEEMTTGYTRSNLVLKHGKSEKKYPLQYQVLYRSRDRIGDTEAGLITDQRGQPLLDLGPGAPRGPFHSDAPDGTTLLKRAGPKAVEQGYLLTQFELAPDQDAHGNAVALHGKLPMVMNLLQLGQDAATGQLSAVALQPVDLAAIGGIWTPCAASPSPWGSHLAGEEYEPDGRLASRLPLASMNAYLGTPGKLAADGGASPYAYGHIVEARWSAKGVIEPLRRYAMGRRSAELATVMPDERTVYFGDDGRDTALFMFIADKPRDLSRGTLYAAEWRQRSGERGGDADLRWIRLGQADDDEVRGWISSGLRFEDMFETAPQADATAGFRAIQAAPVNAVQILRPRPGQERPAAFLETRRYAAWRGATTEFTKMEGVALNRADRQLYIAMSYLESGMLDGQNGQRPQDHIRLAGAPRDLICGAVYVADLRPQQRDSDGRAIASAWVAQRMRALLSGAAKPAGQTSGPYDHCDTERLANPDNLAYSEALRTLFIGEDSVLHLNNFLWAYSVDNGQLTRIASAPLGAEWTGLNLGELNGHTYLFANLQHPGAASELERYPTSIRVGARQAVDPRGAVGVLWGWPKLPVTKK